jgi:hypothetical protein
MARERSDEAVFLHRWSDNDVDIARTKDGRLTVVAAAHAAMDAVVRSRMSLCLQSCS